MIERFKSCVLTSLVVYSVFISIKLTWACSDIQSLQCHLQNHNKEGGYQCVLRYRYESLQEFKDRIKIMLPKEFPNDESLKHLDNECRGISIIGLTFGSDNLVEDKEY